MGLITALATLGVLLCAICAKCTPPSADKFETLFAELEKLQYQRTIVPTDHETAVRRLGREREIEHDFIVSGTEGIQFLLEKLADINRKEAAAISGPDDTDGALLFHASESEAGRATSLVRYAICFTLSDIYPLASPPQREEIIKAIVDSFLPSTHAKDDYETMVGPLFRMGKDGVRGFVLLADSPSKFNRCHAFAILEELTKKSVHMDCNADAPNRARMLKEFNAWWNLNSSTVQWPSFPGYFDPAPQRPKREEE